MTNRINIFKISFAVIFFVSATLLSVLQYKDQKQIDFSFVIGMPIFLAFLGSAIAALVLPAIPNIEATAPKRPLAAIRIAFIAGLVSFVGGGLAFFGFLSFGRVLVASGIIIGNIFMVIYFVTLISSYLGNRRRNAQQQNRGDSFPPRSDGGS